MNLLSRLRQNYAESRRLLEQSKHLIRFCLVKTASIAADNSQQCLAVMQKIDKGKQVPEVSINLPKEFMADLKSKQGAVISSAYGSTLIELISSLYCQSSIHFYLVIDKVEPLPFLQQLVDLSRVTIVSHQLVLKKRPESHSIFPVFISMAEFHPKTFSSDLKVAIHGVDCIFSSFAWLLKNKQDKPLYFLNAINEWSSAQDPNEMYKHLAFSYQAPSLNIYSWSRLHSHKSSQLKRRFIAKTNQLEALLRYIRPVVNTVDFQPMLETIKQQKIQSLARSNV